VNCDLCKELDKLADERGVIEPSHDCGGSGTAPKVILLVPTKSEVHRGEAWMREA
jgi:hypothetical protein